VLLIIIDFALLLHLNVHINLKDIRTRSLKYYLIVEFTMKYVPKLRKSELRKNNLES